MASKAREGDGWRVQWFDASGKRQSIRTGKMSESNADGIRRRIEGLLAAKASGEPMPKSLCEWVAELSDRKHGALAAKGLLEPREARRAWTVGELLERFFDALNVKPGTRATYEQVRPMLEEHFGANRTLANVTPLDAQAWVNALRDSGLAPATQSRRLRTVKGIFSKGERWGMVASNPFADFKAGSMSNAERVVFVPREVIARVIEVCPDSEWRAVFALARFGGLRCPSEVLRLRWRDIDWDAGRMRVRSPKTEAIEGRGHRLVPLFPELRGLLLEAYEAAEDGAEYVVTRYRSEHANLRTQAERICERAGVGEWPKLFQNLRASRATELAAAFPARDAAAWLGHSVAIAQAHYQTPLDSNFTEATKTPTGPMLETGADSGAQTGQKAARRGGARRCEAAKTEAQTFGACTDTHQMKTPCTTAHNGPTIPP
jgi:integrase